MALTPPHIEYHADDYGLFLTQSQRILACHYSGRLNGVSVMPNTSDLAACMELIKPVQNQLSLTIHLNFMEGKSLAGRAQVPLLTDECGNLNRSFGTLLLRSCLPGRATLVQQLKAEIRAQIRSAVAFLQEDRPLRLDGHAHYHMLPVVFDAMMDVIREDGLRVSYIRMPREYIGIYLRHWKQLGDFAPINLAKVLILNALVWRNRRKYGEYLEKLEQKVFMGVFLSGRMYRKNVEPLLPDAVALAEKKAWGLEILAHPGGVYEEKDIARITNESDIHFLTSQLRSKEATLFEIYTTS